MLIDECTSFLGLSSSASQLGMIKHNKFDHILDTIFCWFWTESVQCGPGGDRGSAMPQLGHRWATAGPPLGHRWATAGPLLGLKTFLGTWECRQSKLIYQNNYS